MAIKLFKAFFILSSLLVFLIYRYNSLGVESEQIFYFAGYFSLASISLMYSLFKYENAINPISVFTIFIFLLAYSFIKLSLKQSVYSENTLVIINLSLFCYLVLAVQNYPAKTLKICNLDNSLKIKLLYVIISFAAITFFLECVMFGYLPVLNISSSDVYIDTNEKLIPFLHYFIVILAFVPSWSYIYYKEGLLGKKRFRFILLITLFILVNYLSRQLYLLLGITFLLSYIFYNNIKTKILIRLSFLVVALFLIIGYLKFNSELSISFAEFSRLAAGIENENVSILESTFTEYSSKRYTVLDEMVRTRDDIHYYGFGVYTFRPLLSFFLLEKLGVIVRIQDLDSERKVGTFLIDPYLDFGLFGVVIINSLYGVFASRYYKQYILRNPEAIIKFSIIIFCLLMGMFINYFNTMLIWLGLIMNKFLLSGFEKNKQ